MGQRLDIYCAEHDIAQSRSRAQNMIKNGKIAVNGEIIRKPGHMLDEGDKVTAVEADHPWVSRAALKLEHALSHFHIDVKGKVAMDIGSSTGGFTEVLLHHGAAHIFAIDSGTDQMVSPLRDDSRITLYQQTNARHITTDMIDRPVDVLVCDASFIALEQVLPRPMEYVATQGHVIALIKPQFEAGKGNIGKGGIVKDSELHDHICDKILKWLTHMGWTPIGLCDSPLIGGSGNKEFLVAAIKGKSC